MKKRNRQPRSREALNSELIRRPIRRCWPLFLLPTALAFCIGFLYPFLLGLYRSFCEFTSPVDYHWAGFSNYIRAFADEGFRRAFGFTAAYAVVSILIINICAFALAYALTQKLRGSNIFRTVFFMPNLIGGIVLGYVWKFVFNRAFVAIAEAATQTDHASLLSTPNGAMFCLILVSVWQYAGYMMLIYVAGFMSVDQSLKEAAMIDGCNKGKAMWHVVIPLMRSSFVQCIFLSTTRCFMVYDLNLSLTKGEPFNQSVLAAMHVYNQAFVYKNYGTGQAEALVLFIVCAVIGMLQVYFGKKGEVAA